MLTSAEYYMSKKSLGLNDTDCVNERSRPARRWFANRIELDSAIFGGWPLFYPPINKSLLFSLNCMSLDFGPEEIKTNETNVKIEWV